MSRHLIVEKTKERNKWFSPIQEVHSCENVWTLLHGCEAMAVLWKQALVSEVNNMS